MDKTRYILAIAGEGSRWNNHLGVRKHFALIDGEPNILRTIRLLRYYDPNCEIYIGQNPAFPVSIPTTITYDGTTYMRGAESDRYIASEPYWNKEGRTVLIWGDVFFTEDAIRKLCAMSSDWLRYGRVGRYQHNHHKHYGEEFAISFNPIHHYLVLQSSQHVERLSLSSGTQLYGAIYLSMVGVPDNEIIQYSNSGQKPDLGHMVIIDDMTDDFDFPSDYDNFVNIFKAAQCQS